MNTWSSSAAELKARHVSTSDFTSYRAITRSESDAFSLHDTVVPAGATLELCYQGRREYVYVLSGTADVTQAESGETISVSAGDTYVVFEGERHTLHATSELRGICCFTPPTRGDEVHDATGSYPL